MEIRNHLNRTADEDEDEELDFDDEKDLSD